MIANSQQRPANDMHTHVHPDMAATLAKIMETNHLSHVVNLGSLEALGIPVREGMMAFERVLGDSVVYFSTPDFSRITLGFGQRMAEDLERKVEAGARGLKIFKELGLVHRDATGCLIPVDDPGLDPLWAKAGELAVPVLMHIADPVAFFQPLTEDNERWDELQAHPEWHFGRPRYPDHDTLLAQRNHVIERHPNTIFIGAHLGNYPEDLDYVDACLERYPNFFVDTTARIGEIGRHPVERVRGFFHKYQDRVLFGTDLTLGWDAFDEPEHDDLQTIKLFYDRHWRFFETRQQQIEHPYPIQGHWKVNAIGLPAEVLDKLYSGIALRLIPGL